MGSSKLSRRADGKKDHKALRKPPLVCLVSGRWDLRPGRVYSSAMAVPTWDTTEVVICLRNCPDFNREWDTAHSERLCRLHGQQPAWSVNSLLVTSYLFLPITWIFTLQKIKHRKYQVLQCFPWTEILEIPCETFAIISTQKVSSPNNFSKEQVLISNQNEFITETMYSKLLKSMC